MNEQKHAGVSVEMKGDGDEQRPVVFLAGVDVTYLPADMKHAIVLPTLDDANALRDALSAFLAYQRSRS